MLVLALVPFLLIGFVWMKLLAAPARGTRPAIFSESRRHEDAKETLGHEGAKIRRNISLLNLLRGRLGGISRRDRVGRRD